MEIEIDFWPKISPYLEIEGNTAEEVEQIVNLLGYELSQTTTANTVDIYLQQEIDLKKIKQLKFDK